MDVLVTCKNQEDPITTPEFVKDMHNPIVAVSDHYPIQFTRLKGKPHIKRQQHTIIYSAK